MEVYVEDLIERQASRPREGTRGIDVEEVDRVLGSLSEVSEGRMASLPEVYTREVIYREHD